MKKGFTLLELLVAAFVFSLVFSVVSGILAMSIKYQKYNLAHHRLISEASYAIEYMARALRMAQSNSSELNLSGENCPDSGRSFKVEDGRINFVTYDGSCASFFHDVDSDDIKIEGGDPFCCGGLALTSGDFEVINFQFYVDGDTGTADNKQPRVTIYLELREKNLTEKPRIVVQTTVSQRNLDI